MTFDLNKIRIIVIVLTFLLKTSHSFSQSEKYVMVRAQPYDGIAALLQKYHLPATSQYLEKFRDLNSEKIVQGDQLITDELYRLPILIFPFDGSTIRSSIGIQDYERAKKIEKYNEMVYNDGLLHLPFQSSRRLWVPFFDYRRQTLQSHSLYFGEGYQQVTTEDYKLSGCVYYLDAGHGGPDPGAIGRREGHQMSEDEYAYDITLRLARCLLQHNATVYMIVQDPNDGIRDEQFLRSDSDERYYGNVRISDDRRRRLRQRTQIINRLFKQHQARGHKQQVIVIHCDSRSQGKKIDIFFYHTPGSQSGKKLANTLHQTIKSKYRANQPDRPYHGVIKSRNLFMLRESYPVAVYIELGNIRNSFDQLRLIMENNRQAIANWLCNGLIDARF